MELDEGDEVTPQVQVPLEDPAEYVDIQEEQWNEVIKGGEGEDEEEQQEEEEEEEGDERQIKKSNHNFYDWITIGYTIIFLVIPMIGLYLRDDEVDEARNEVLVSDSVHVHWSFIAVIAFMFNHLLYNLGDLIGFWNDPSTRNTLYLKNRIIVNFASLIPSFGFYFCQASKHGSMVYMTACYSIQILWYAYVACTVLETSETKFFKRWQLQILLFLFSFCNVLNVFCNASMNNDSNPSSIYLYFIYWVLYLSVAVYWFVFSIRYFWAINVIKLLFSSKEEEMQETIVLITATSPYGMFIYFIVYFLTVDLLRGSEQEEDVQYRFLNELVCYNIFVILFSIPLLVVPERLSRLRYKKMMTTLMDASTTLTNKVHPEIRQISDSLHVLKYPTGLPAAFLDPDFREHFQIVAEGCDRVLNDVEDLRGGVSIGTGFSSQSDQNYGSNQIVPAPDDSPTPPDDMYEIKEEFEDNEERWGEGAEEDQDEEEEARILANLPEEIVTMPSIPSRPDWFLRECAKREAMTDSRNGHAIELFPREINGVAEAENSSTSSFHPTWKICGVTDISE